MQQITTGDTSVDLPAHSRLILVEKDDGQRKTMAAKYSQIIHEEIKGGHLRLERNNENAYPGAVKAGFSVCVP